MVTTAQQPNYLMQVMGKTTALQVLAGFLGGIASVPFANLLAAVKRHAVIPEAPAVRRCAAGALKQHRGKPYNTLQGGYLWRRWIASGW